MTKATSTDRRSKPLRCSMTSKSQRYPFPGEKGTAQTVSQSLSIFFFKAGPAVLSAGQWHCIATLRQYQRSLYEKSTHVRPVRYANKATMRDELKCVSYVSLCVCLSLPNSEIAVTL